MARSQVDLPSLLMVLFLTSNLVIGLFDPSTIPVPKEIGILIFVCGALLFMDVLSYLRRGFLGQTKPTLSFLITNGPYRFCRHPQYLSFLIMLVGMDVAFRSVLGLIFTFSLSVPSVVYRARVEDTLLKDQFGTEWENYAKHTGMFLGFPSEQWLFFLVLGVGLGLVMDFLHECGHALWGIAMGGVLTSLQVAYFEIYPHLALTSQFFLGKVEVQGLTGFQYGLFLLGGSITTNIVSWLIAIVLQRRPLGSTMRSGLKILGAFGLLDLPLYVVLPQIGLHHWLILGGQQPEPLLGARRIGIPDSTFYAALIVTTLGLSYLYFKPLWKKTWSRLQHSND